jgi:hypothetical protein
MAMAALPSKLVMPMVLSAAEVDEPEAAAAAAALGEVLDEDEGRTMGALLDDDDEEEDVLEVEEAREEEVVEALVDEEIGSATLAVELEPSPEIKAPTPGGGGHMRGYA